MTKHQAKVLANFDLDYVARKIKGEWCVWCKSSDHVVEFDNVEQLIKNIENSNVEL